ncbi:MAG: bifunctional diaminohydroxyphosphoribosylaminopyrimidine deaminase/5-amino-6-(5-phosphoribosylamino)uracil reductase RibD, partial [Gammaproteobacteria bacterium]|nr:bifunctional diaminohydroxyphosphoribosylaminopyrimidine deaminase/5-amino-6-(5-phosphoribosylamino)uracil reductase RibD [Gammaproteobacteria bacterium]
MSNFSEQDYHFMARAIQLADRPILSPHPNPRVGCVIMRDGETVGEGWHAMAGRDHAEAMALKQAGDRAQGATAYVTLEPCSHHGRTPPCADALIEAGVKRVVMAMDDPSEKVNGQGKVRLQQAGIAVESGLLQQQAESLNKGFIKRHRLGMPWIRIKSAMTLDGRTAMSNGESKWITAEAARRDVQRLRAQCDAILTGIGTV